MALHFGLRFDFRNPDFAGTSMADRYEAALEMAEWADRAGGVNVSISEHHASADGYIPSPLVLLASMSARTTKVQLWVSALIAPFYDPLRLAEDLLVLDHISRGRVGLVVAGGYVPEEFELHGVPMNERARRVTEAVKTIKAAFTGEPFEFRGRSVHLTPGPYQAGGPTLLLGGTSETAARRAARIADGFVPSTHDVWDFYRDELRQLGKPDPGPGHVGSARTVALAEDPEKGWEVMAPFFLHETNAYGSWAQPGVPSPYRVMRDVDELRGSGLYAVLTPDEFVAELRAEAHPFPHLHPLCGGMPVDVAWSSLRLFEEQVLPAFASGLANRTRQEVR
jgi:alkanesulfonate monooxygenase SsuD/methylene tetrahydromethanopterin reductase-like flavin-dependent oxidoreductase (luciferase family)